MSEKIAIVTDSGSDVNQKYTLELPIFKLPLRVIIDGKEYSDDSLSNQEIFQAMESTKVTTSLPSPKEVETTLDNIKDLGYTHVIAVLLSSWLSGTYNTISLLAQDYQGLEIHVIDSKNISIASGFSAIEAARMAKDNIPYQEIINKIENNLNKKKVFFTVGTLEYLREGGRIGLVAGTVADVLNIKPLISCNDDGVYYTVKKTRGYRKSISMMLELAKEYLGDTKNYELVLLDAQSAEDFTALKEKVKTVIPYDKEIEVEKITPALAIHTGPEAVGIAVRIID